MSYINEHNLALMAYAYIILYFIVLIAQLFKLTAIVVEIVVRKILRKIINKYNHNDRNLRV